MVKGGVGKKPLESCVMMVGDMLTCVVSLYTISCPTFQCLDSNCLFDGASCQGSLVNNSKFT